MNPIVAIASFCPACCCTVDSWTLMNGLISFSSPEGQRIWDVRFSQQCFSRSKSSAMCCSVLSWEVPRIFKDHSAYIFRVKLSKNRGSPWRWMHYDPSSWELLTQQQKHHISEKWIFNLTMYYYLMKWQNNLYETQAYNFVILGVQTTHEDADILNSAYKHKYKTVQIWHTPTQPPTVCLMLTL